MVTFSVAALAAACATFWALKSTSPATATQARAAVIFQEALPADPQAVARVLGGGLIAAAAPGLAAERAGGRFKLLGVVAERSPAGYALISVDGKPAKPFRVGTQVDDGLLLQSVAPRSAALAARLDAQVSVTLELPKPGSP